MSRHSPTRRPTRSLAGNVDTDAATAVANRSLPAIRSTTGAGGVRAGMTRLVAGGPRGRGRERRYRGKDGDQHRGAKQGRGAQVQVQLVARGVGVEAICPCIGHSTPGVYLRMAQLLLHQPVPSGLNTGS